MSILGLILALGFGAHLVSGCALSTYDQLGLIQISMQAPPAGETTLQPLGSTRVQCTKVGTFVVVRRDGPGQMYVLDSNRVFRRWGMTGAGMASAEQLLGYYFDSIKSTDLHWLWTQYGRPGYSEAERASMDSVGRTKLTWSALSLLSDDEYQRLMKVEPSPEEAELIRALAFERLRYWVDVSVNGPYDQFAIRLSRIVSHAVDVRGTVSYRPVGGRVVERQFELPIHIGTPPYVGYPTVFQPVPSRPPWQR